MRDTAPALIVEFLGVPGSGKSTVARALAGRLAASGLRVINPMYELSRSAAPLRIVRKAWFAGLALTAAPARFRLVSRLLVSLKAWNGPVRLLLLFNFLVLLGVHRRLNRRTDVCLFDQGFHQWISSAAVRAAGRHDAPSVIRAFLDLLSGVRIDLVVMLDVDLVEIIRRLELRAGSASYVEKKSDRKDALCRYADVIDEIRGGLHSAVMTLENNTLEDSVVSLARAITSARRSVTAVPEIHL